MNTETDSQNPSPADPSDRAQNEAPATEAKAPAEAGAAAAPAPDAPEVEIAKLKERLLRTLADFDNFRKRSRRDVADAERRVQEDLLRSLLPTFDNLERAVTALGRPHPAIVAGHMR